MARTIAISGKGGSGKTTIAAMIIKSLLEQGNKPILAVDADPNSCLAAAMGIQLGRTVAQLREDALKRSTGAVKDIDRMRSLEYGIQQIVTEAKGFDLLTMGRPEGPGCYCAVNNMLRKFLDDLSSAYEYVVTDNEAGMEHLSRRTTNCVDRLVIVAEPTPMGAVTAGRIFTLAKSLPISVNKIGLIWNNTSPIADSRLAIENRKSKIENIDVFGCVPYDESVFKASMNGATVFDLAHDSGALSAIRSILEKLDIKY